MGIVCERVEPTSHPSSMPTKSPITTNEPSLNPSISPITSAPTPIPTTTNPTSQPKYWSAPCGIASTWHKAMTYCVNHNAQLATFKTLDDLTSIKQICDQSECDNYCWLGFLDPDYDGQYTFIDGTMVDHNIIPWGEHPEDYHNQDCGCIVKTSKHSAVDIWDCSCAYSSHGFICETVEQPLPSKYWPIPCGTISSWNEGKTYCEDNNAKLATAGSVIDLQAIKKACDEAGSCHYCWGGWSDPDFDGQYTFVDGTPVDHSKIPWTETHPEDYFDHDCGCIPQTSKHASLGIWDCSCHHASYSAVCESLTPTPRPSPNPTISPIPTRAPTSNPSVSPTEWKGLHGYLKFDDDGTWCLTGGKISEILSYHSLDFSFYENIYFSKVISGDNSQCVVVKTDDDKESEMYYDFGSRTYSLEYDKDFAKGNDIETNQHNLCAAPSGGHTFHFDYLHTNGNKKYYKICTYAWLGSKCCIEWDIRIHDNYKNQNGKTNDIGREGKLNCVSGGHELYFEMNAPILDKTYVSVKPKVILMDHFYWKVLFIISSIMTIILCIVSTFSNKNKQQQYEKVVINDEISDEDI
eukprot:22493_1